MPDVPKLRTLSGIIYEQTEAQWAADQRVFGSNVQLVPIDGLNAGKHKLADGIHTYAELNFVENASSGGSPGGSNTQVQYNDAGSFGGITNGTTGQVLKAGTPPAFGTQEADDVTVDRYFVLSSGSIATSTFVQTGTQNGKPLYEQVGGAGTVIWADAGTGLQWNVTPDGSTVIYLSTEDVADPTLVTSWTADLGGNPPLPSLSALYGPTVQDALEQVAQAAEEAPTIELVVTQSGTDVPVAIAVRKTNTTVSVTFSYEDPDLFLVNAPGFVLETCQLMITANTQSGPGYIFRNDDNSAYFGLLSGGPTSATYSITLKQLQTP